MKDFLITFRFLLKQSLSLRHSIHKIKSNKKYRNMFILLFVVLIMCAPSYIYFMKTFTNLFKGFQALGVSYLFIVLAIIASVVLIVFFGMFQIISFFYFSNDVKVLTPMPIKPSHFLISKFFVIYLWELILSAFIILPFFIIYGIYSNLYIYQWITMIGSFVLLPIIPLVIISILTVLLMSLTNVFKSKDALRMIGYMVLLFGLLGFQMLMFQTFMPTEAQDINQFYIEIVSNIEYFISQFSIYYPISQLIEYTITGSIFQAVFSLILFILISLAFIYLLSQVLQSIFINSYMKEQNNPSRKKKVKHQNLDNRKGLGDVSLSFAKIDFVTLLKVPIYAFNSLLLVVLLPVLFIVMTTVMQSAGDAEQLNQFINMYEQYKNELWLAVSLFLIVTAALMPISSTTFSREGKTNWIMRTLPVSSKEHILGRFWTPFFTQLTLNIVMIILLVFVLINKGFSIEENIIYGVVTLIVSLIASIPLFFTGIYIDLKRPMLKWDNPQQPVKQNMNVLILMGIGIGYVTALYFLYRYVFKLFLPINIMFVLLFTLGLILTYITYRLLEKQFDKNLVVMD